MFDPDAHMPRVNRGLVYLGACLIAGIRLARERQVNVKVVPTALVRQVRASRCLAKFRPLTKQPLLNCRQRTFAETE
jgi:hypothetical protein